MNNTVKQILSEKLDHAKKKEGLDNAEISYILNLKSKHYAGRLCSKIREQRDNASEEAWRSVQQWTNSGLSLRQYGEKMGNLRNTMATIEQNLEELGIKEEDRKVTKEDMELVDEDPAVTYTKSVIKDLDRRIQPEGIHEQATHMNNGPWQAMFKGMDPTPSPMTEEIPKKEIGRPIIHETGIDYYKTEDIPQDRLSIIFNAIRELQEMGYQVDINIYQKEKR